jgi:hypothetical protein
VVVREVALKGEVLGGLLKVVALKVGVLLELLKAVASEVVLMIFSFFLLHLLSHIHTTK